MENKDSQKDLKRVHLFALNEQVILPCDEESLPLSVDTDDKMVFWIAFESPELGQSSTAVDPTYYKWGQMRGMQYLKYLHERIEEGGEHHLIINPGTARQIAMNNDAILNYLNWLDANPNGFDV